MLKAARWLVLLAVLPLAACLEKDVGFVKIVAPAALTTPSYLLHVNAVESGPLKDGAVLRQQVGDTEVELKRNGVTVAACKFVVKKNQRVVVTFSGPNRKCEATT